MPTGLECLSDLGVLASVTDSTLVRFIAKVTITKSTPSVNVTLKNPLRGTLFCVTKEITGPFNPIGNPTGTDVKLSLSSDRKTITVSFIASTQSQVPLADFNVFLGVY